ALSAKTSTRVLEDRERRKNSPGERDMRRVLGGILIEYRALEVEDRSDMQVVTETQPGKREWDDLLFAWRIAHFVHSNAIVLVKDLATVGIGAGPLSRVDALAVSDQK